MLDLNKLNLQQKEALEIAENIIQKFFNYSFKNKKLLLEAITHASFYFENSYISVNFNERLEFLGDSVLSLAISQHFFSLYKDKDEGYLTRQRALVVCEKTLADLAKNLGWEKCLIMGRGESQNEGQLNPNNLANAMEALFGALFLETDFKLVSSWIVDLLTPYIVKASSGKLIYDYKSKLFEYIHIYLQKNNLPNIEANIPKFSLLYRKGPDHNPLFGMGIYFQNILLAEAEGKSKKEAEQKAAFLALEKLEGR